jgi:hypothetical protein
VGNGMNAKVVIKEITSGAPCEHMVHCNFLNKNYDYNHLIKLFKTPYVEVVKMFTFKMMD